MEESTLQFDDNIDFGKLQDEHGKAVAFDEKYQRENDAKFRAIHQKVASYDEFRDIVLASHLKPLDRKDKVGGIGYQGWNNVASGHRSNVTDGKIDQDSTKMPSWTIPKTSAEFDAMWKRCCTTKEEKFKYLLAIGPENLGNLLKTEAPLGQIVTALNGANELENNLEAVLDILNVFSVTKRFSLSLSFLEDTEKKELTDLLEKCKVLIDDKQSVHLASLAEKYTNVCSKYLQ